MQLEGEATARAIRLAGFVNTPLYVVHVMSIDAMEEIARARKSGFVFRILYFFPCHTSLQHKVSPTKTRVLILFTFRFCILILLTNCRSESCW